MDLNQMLVFERVCATKSFTAAAHDLGLKKSNVSMKISALEIRLGVKLLNRTTRKVSLTEVGEEYYQQCQQILGKIQEVDQRLQDGGPVARGVLRVAMPLDFGLFCIKNFLNDFTKKYPEITVDMHLSHQMATPEEGFDLVIWPTNRRLQDSNLIVKKLFESPLYLFASEKYFRSHEKELTKANGNFNFIQLDPFSSKSFQRTRRGIFAKDPRLTSYLQRTKYVLSDMLACRDACLSHLGFAVLPVWLVQEEWGRNELVALPKSQYHDKATFYALYAPGKWQPKKLKIFLEALRLACARFT